MLCGDPEKMATEIEVKILNIDPTRIRSVFKQHGAKLRKNVLQHNEIYRDRKHPELMARIRTEGNTTILTMKGKSKKVRGMKVVDEHELEVSDAEEIAWMLRALGFERTSLRELKREYWEYNGCSVEICLLPGFPAYLEIEGAPSKIRATARLLGYAEADFDARPISKIYPLGKRVVFEK
jgi:predicted adenylyl cyclase CyaB